MIRSAIKTVAIVVAHPDDETLWAGGTILSHPLWKCFIVCLSRKSDPERAAKFYKALQVFKCEGIMGDLDDGPDQKPLDEKEVQRVILELLPGKHFDLLISHNPSGEYTRHLRHEEVGKAVIKLWHSGKISATELWAFAYQDGNNAFYPRAVVNADVFHTLTKRIWLRKYSLMTETYGFDKNSWEAETTPKAESFWQFTDPIDAKRWLANLKM
ncbi:MAG: PIG-L family deacetylase [Lentimicrobiaceae bacterium]|jgi:LmbE family N-acetylglucosaminyl deacetylase